MDVIAVDMTTHKVRILARGMIEANADAIVRMAVMRRGVDEEFFVAVPDGRYAEGDDYKAE